MQVYSFKDKVEKFFQKYDFYSKNDLFCKIRNEKREILYDTIFLDMCKVLNCIELSNLKGNIYYSTLNMLFYYLFFFI